MGRVPAVGLFLASAVLLASCGEEPVQEHRVPKGVESVPDQPSDSELPESPPAPAGEEPRPRADGEPWVLPQGWVVVPGERPMRLATVEAPDPDGPVEVAITRFPGRVGGDLANVNRWRGQMGLGAIGENELEAMLSRFVAPGFEGYEVRVEGEQMHMLASGVYEIDADQTWFVRATVRPEVADRLEADVFTFARSIAGLESGERR
ncbi:MAG: hypothetical protein ACNA8P_00865 [Phycisphaerales bacterium]